MVDQARSNPASVVSMSRMIHPAKLGQIAESFALGAEMLESNRDCGGDGWWKGIELIQAALDEYRTYLKPPEIPPEVYTPKCEPYRSEQ